MNRSKIFLSLFICMIISSTSSAQEKDTIGYLYLGPSLGLTGAMNIADYHVSDVRRSLGLGIDVGVIASYNFEKDNYVTLGLHYYNLTFEDLNQYVYANNDARALMKKLTTKGSFSYLTIAPMFKLTVLVIGFQLGIPLGGTAENSSGEATGKVGVPVKDESKSVSASDMNFQFEPRIGIELPIIERKQWSLYFGLSFGYPVQNISSPPFEQPKLNDNFKLPNFQISISSLFELTKL